MPPKKKTSVTGNQIKFSSQVPLGGKTHDSGLSLGITGAKVKPSAATSAVSRRRSSAAGLVAPPAHRNPTDVKRPQGGSTRVGRLLRDARAAVEAPYRPETPVDFATAGGFLNEPAARKAPLRGVRLTALPQAGGEASSLVSSTSQLQPSEFMVSLSRAEGNVGVQVALLRELTRWLANPTNRLWPEVLQYMTHYIHSVNSGGSPSSSSVASNGEEREAAVALSMSSVILRNSTLDDCPALHDVLQFLYSLTEAGLSKWIEREVLFEPLLHVLSSEKCLQDTPEVVLEVVNILRNCTHPSTEDTTETDGIVLQLVTLGVVPSLNTLVKKVIDREVREESTTLGTMLLPSVCLVYRNLAAGVAAHHLTKLGSLDLLLHILSYYKECSGVVESCARALAKAVFEEDCANHYANSELFLRTTMAALSTQLESAEKDPKPMQLLTARLVAAMAHVAERSPDQVNILASAGGPLLLKLVSLYMNADSIAVEKLPNARRSSNPSQVLRDAAGEEQITLHEAISWLVGITAMSPHCSADFVFDMSSKMTNFLKDLDLQPQTRLTAIYTLMCLSNLSYFFAAIEKQDVEAGLVSGDAENGISNRLEQLFATLGLIIAGFLFEGDVEATVESTRLLGNLSYTNSGRAWMEENRCDEVVVVFLGHEDLRVVYNCFGVLLNLSATTNCRVVQDQELLHMMLKHTGKYTKQEDIDSAAREEKRLLLKSAKEEQGADLILTEKEAAEKAVTEVAVGFAEQTGELVEKLLANVYGLLNKEEEAE
ncbi:hypothetical protein AGDE_09528 [Angomonas deanei]|nr:hypothetical protein AGDE_09528 [Angomonas deanei]|eukprot:EPY30270.1 hypothetical protein AGDE_09528 [Angomonas deanei]